CLTCKIEELEEDINNGGSGGGGGDGSYVLPVASATILGGIKVGTNLTIDAGGILSAKDTKYTTSAALAADITDETGTGKLVFNNNPLFANKITTPDIYVPSMPAAVTIKTVYYNTATGQLS